MTAVDSREETVQRAIDEIVRLRERARDTTRDALDRARDLNEASRRAALVMEAQLLDRGEPAEQDAP